MFSIILLFLSILFALPISGQTQDPLKSGMAKLNGLIKDYKKESCPDNILVYFNNNLINEHSTMAIPIAEDGTFSATIPLATTSFARFVGDNCYFDLFLEPDSDLDVEFNWTELVEYFVSIRKGEENPLSPFKFGGKSGEINKELLAYPVDDTYIDRNFAHDVTPSDAHKKITAKFEKQSVAVNDYIKANHLNPTTVKVLLADVKCKYLYDLLSYERERGYLQYSDSLAPSLKEPIDLRFFETIKGILADKDNWMVASHHFGGIPNALAFSSLKNLLGYDDLYIISFDDNPFTYLESIGASLTPEEEEASDWLDRYNGKACNIKDFFKSYNLIVKVAERNEMTDKLNEFNKKHSDSDGKSTQLIFSKDIINCIINSNETIKSYLCVDSVPLLWQIMNADALRSRHELTERKYDRKQVLDILAELESTGGITNHDIMSSLKDYYHKVFALKSFDMPDDERGKVIRDIIAPYAGKILLLDFWGTNCGQCIKDIKNSAETRAKNHNHPDFKILYISSDESPESIYNSMVEKYLADETCFRIPVSDYHLLRDLFNFSGIPRYVLINRDGNKVLDSDLFYHDLKSILKNHGVNLN